MASPATNPTMRPLNNRLPPVSRPPVSPPAKATKATRTLLVKIWVESLVLSAVEKRRSGPPGPPPSPLPEARGLTWAMRAASTGWLLDQKPNPMIGPNSSSTEITNGTGRSAMRRQYPRLRKWRTDSRRDTLAYTRLRAWATSASKAATGSSPAKRRRAWARSAAAERYRVPSRRTCAALSRSTRPRAPSSSCCSSSHPARRSARKAGQVHHEATGSFPAVEYEDRLRITTPEGLDIDVVVAGLGSRFIALLIDVVIQTVVILALGAAFGVLGDLGAAAFALAGFLIFFGYPVLFEVMAGGRTPGKRMTGLRVVTTDAGPIGFVSSAVRSVVRLIDLLPATYTVGMVAVLVSERNQRLGDLAAGTLVIRDRVAAGATSSLGTGFRGGAGGAPVQLPPDAPSWDLSAVSSADVAAVRAFLLRRWELPGPARQQIGTDLADRLAPRVSGPPTGQGVERFLELVVAAKDQR